MSKRKTRNEGPAYCDYQDLFDSITIELEHLYHTLWDKRKEAPKFRTMGKQAKTAWMLWKLGSAEYWRSEGEGLHYTNQLEERRKNHRKYVRAKYENDPTDLDEWDETLDVYLCKVRHNKAMGRNLGRISVQSQTQQGQKSDDALSRQDTHGMEGRQDIVL